MKTHQKSKNKSLRSEAVLVLQGGGSLGAYECGVYKKLFERGIEFDILAGSSIGAINASIICSAQNAKKDAAAVLENFWLSISEDIYSKLLPLPLSTLLPTQHSLQLSMDKMMALHHRCSLPYTVIQEHFNQDGLNSLPQIITCLQLNGIIFMTLPP